MNKHTYICTIVYIHTYLHAHTSLTELIVRITLVACVCYYHGDDEGDDGDDDCRWSPFTTCRIRALPPKDAPQGFNDYMYQLQLPLYARSTATQVGGVCIL